MNTDYYFNNKDDDNKKFLFDSFNYHKKHCRRFYFIVLYPEEPDISSFKRYGILKDINSSLSEEEKNFSVLFKNLIASSPDKRTTFTLTLCKYSFGFMKIITKRSL